VSHFYDSENISNLWGKDLYTYLDEIYTNKSRYCVMFISLNYRDKIWTKHERKSAQQRAIKQDDEYILPVKLDDTEIPGIRSTLGYISHKTPKELVNIIIDKLAGGSIPNSLTQNNAMTTRQEKYFESKYVFDEINLPKKIALNLVKIKDHFPFVQSSINNSDITDELIKNYFNLNDTIHELTHYDLYYFRVLYIMRDIQFLMEEVNLYSYEAEIYWDEEDYLLIKKVISDYENIRRKLFWYRYSGNQAEKLRKIAERNRSSNIDFEYKRYIKEMTESIDFLNKTNETHLEFLKHIVECVKMLKVKIKFYSKPND